ncbi:hypothetical protein CABS01_11543 [Colletotrichum abscissum]|uniref:uncharacterized protein n=1 Tax=Colletotrichum abscissum TaxID=1671311 RepID=UPI0027D73AA7|nr:uncharacterized protein CABS01_11543 [Colletotrichum abscissum]KAK1493374.1 hypothetical protein CABS01_11543 [Colletotrichum abscissum]
MSEYVVIYCKTRVSGAGNDTGGLTRKKIRRLRYYLSGPWLDGTVQSFHGDATERLSIRCDVIGGIIPIFHAMKEHFFLH